MNKFIQTKITVKVSPRKIKGATLSASSVCESFLRKEAKLKGRDDEIWLNLILCGETKIRSLNRDFRNKDKVTDVLSFPIFNDLKEFSQFPGPRGLGDIYICHQRAMAQSKRLKVSYENEILHLIIHGFLHLLGFDHERSLRDEKIMLKYEKQLVKESSSANGEIKMEQSLSIEFDDCRSKMKNYSEKLSELRRSL